MIVKGLRKNHWWTSKLSENDSRCYVESKIKAMKCKVIAALLDFKIYLSFTPFSIPLLTTMPKKPANLAPNREKKDILKIELTYS